MSLSTTIDSTYADRTAGDAQHQRDHDVVHASVNAVDAAFATAVTAGFSGTKQAWLESMVKKVGGDTITASGATVTPLVVKGATGQSANLFEARDSDGAVLARVAASGNIVAPRMYVAGAEASVGGIVGMGIFAPAANQQALVVQGLAAQTANLFEARNSAGTTIMSVTAGGFVVAEDVRANSNFQIMNRDAVGARAGGTAPALPAQPVTYLRVSDQDGNARYIPAYA